MLICSAGRLESGEAGAFFFSLREAGGLVGSPPPRAPSPPEGFAPGEPQGVTSPRGEADLEGGQIRTIFCSGCARSAVEWDFLAVVRLDPRAAIIPPTKLRDHLLATTHWDGRGKANYLARLGYSQEGFRQLEADLRVQILPLEAQPQGASRWGQKYEIVGLLTGPNNRTGWVRTIWIILAGETAARLVTLIPAEEP